MKQHNTHCQKNRFSTHGSKQTSFSSQKVKFVNCMRTDKRKNKTIFLETAKMLELVEYQLIEKRETIKLTVQRKTSLVIRTKIQKMRKNGQKPPI